MIFIATSTDHPTKMDNEKCVYFQEGYCMLEVMVTNPDKCGIPSLDCIHICGWVCPCTNEWKKGTVPQWNKEASEYDIE